MGLLACPVLANTEDEGFTFNFDYCDDTTKVVWKETAQPMYMYCTGTAGLTNAGFSAAAHSVNGGTSEEYTLFENDSVGCPKTYFCFPH